MIAFSDISEVRSVVDNEEFLSIMKEAYRNSGYELMGYADQGFRVMSTNKVIEDISDFKNQKIRTMENVNHMDFWKAIGASATPMTFSEVYIGLQQNTIDAQENPYEVIVSNKLHEQQKYIVETNHLAHLISLVVSEEFYEKLAEEQRDIIDEAAEVAIEYARKASDSRISEKIDIIKESGTEIIKISDELRNKMGTAAVNAAKAVNYESAGTIEFLLDKHGDFYFMEMNTRIQVEHPVTEMVTSVDIVKEQLNIANGMELSLTQDNIKIDGHSIECRINAENPKLGFAPSPGKIKFLNLPGGNGVRVDTAVYNGYTIPPNYDSMIAKLIVHGKSRDEAIKKMLRALDEFVIEGINTNIEFQISILKNQAFRLGTYDTSFISKEFKL